MVWATALWWEFCFLVGGFVGQQSPFFQEEFPQLASGGGDEKSPQQKKEEESKESQYGPGPSLRPQSKPIEFIDSITQLLKLITAPLLLEEYKDQQYLSCFTLFMA